MAAALFYSPEARDGEFNGESVPTVPIQDIREVARGSSVCRTKPSSHAIGFSPVRQAVFNGKIRGNKW